MPPKTPAVVLRLAITWAISLAASASGQCDPSWMTEVGSPGANMFVNALAGMPDGRLIAGGYFQSIGGVPASYLAQYDGANWSPLGGGVDSERVDAILPMSNGSVLVAGSFASAGGVGGTSCIARWDGSAWNAYGTGIHGAVNPPVVHAVAVAPNGDVIAAGEFITAGSVQARNIARWNGATWSALGQGIGVGESLPRVYAVAVLPNGDVVAGGDFKKAGTISVNNIAKWNGSTWSAMGSGCTGTVSSVYLVRALLVLPNGDLVVGGSFTSADGVPGTSGVARWNSGTWSALGTGLASTTNPIVAALSRKANGDIVAAGTLNSAGGSPAPRIATWDGFAWHPFVTGPDNQVRALATLADGTLAVGGDFHAVGGASSNCVALWGCTCAADYNGDGFVTGEDFDTFVSDFEAGNAAADVNHDTFVTGEDFDFYTDHFVAGC